jgi:hypothetical protein
MRQDRAGTGDVLQPGAGSETIQGGVDRAERSDREVGEAGQDHAAGLGQRKAPAVSHGGLCSLSLALLGSDELQDRLSALPLAIGRDA